MRIVSIVLPDGYASAEDFAKDCGFELAGRRSTDTRTEVLEECAKLLDLRAQDIRLIAGEMSAQEMRSVRAMLNERARAILALKANTPPPREGE